MTATEGGQRSVGLFRSLRAIAVAAAVALLAACSASNDEDVDVFADDRPPGELYNEGLAYLNEGDLTNAIDTFDKVDRQHPYSDWARKSMIMSAYASYRRGRFDDTIQTARRYLNLYPGSADAAYAHYLIGNSHFRQIPDVTRDQEQTTKAIEAFNEIVTRYPDSEYFPDAQQKLIVARDQLAGKEMQIGRYYLERREYLAAINRFRAVVTDYQSTRHVEEALMRLTEAHLSLGLDSEAQTAAAVLGHNFPNSEWYEDAYRLLQSGGLEPAENEGSWISRLFSGRA